jgi:hypothetical protein
MKYIASTFILLLLSILLKGQSLEKKLAASVCNTLDSIDIDKVVSADDKKNIIMFVFSKAVELNQETIGKDKRFNNLHTYEQGRKMGQFMAQSVKPILFRSCPKFKKLFN